MKKEITRRLKSETGNYYGYFVSEKPVGILVMSSDSSGVQGLLAHPGSENVGGILLEHAMQESQNKGNKNIFLDSLNEASTSAYAALGFVNAELPQYEKVMVLEPAKHSDIWTQDMHGKYRLKKYMDTNYVG